MTEVQVQSVSFSYGSHDQKQQVLSDIDLTISQHEIVALVGPSGCGKSTLMNLIAGFHLPNSGMVTTRGKRVDGLNQHVAYLTQRDTLLPWRRVIDNAAVPLEIQGRNKVERRAIAAAYLEKVGLKGFEEKYPHQLSGGMRSRLSLARALIADRPILLMDEPFGALDALLRIQMQQLLMDVWTEVPRTVIYVTHDVSEAVALAHRVIVLGRDPDGIVHQEDIALAMPRDIIALQSHVVFGEACRTLWKVVTGGRVSSEQRVHG
jgi:NitT/TauT family transport system ATP-binding protein